MRTNTKSQNRIIEWFEWERTTEGRLIPFPTLSTDTPSSTTAQSPSPDLGCLQRWGSTASLGHLWAFPLGWGLLPWEHSRMKFGTDSSQLLCTVKADVTIPGGVVSSWPGCSAAEALQAHYPQIWDPQAISSRLSPGRKHPLLVFTAAIGKYIYEDHLTVPILLLRPYLTCSDKTVGGHLSR